jgi:transcriptional regulator with XRE-family HTH domain
MSREEEQICARLRSARERLGLTQSETAKLVGISRERLLIYEYKRAPLKFDIALKFCRQLIISEEWLATGKFEAIETVAGKDEEMEHIYFRQCLDLQSEPAFLRVAPGTLFSSAYRGILGSVYGALVRRYYHLPRLVFTDSDHDELLCRFLTVISQRYFWMLKSEARSLSKSDGLARRMFLRCQVEFGEVLFKRFMGISSPEIRGKEFDFLRAIANDPSYPLGPLHGIETDEHRYPVSSRREALCRAFNLPVTATDDELAEIGGKGQEPWQILMEMSVELAQAYAGRTAPGLALSPSLFRDLRWIFAQIFLSPPLHLPNPDALKKKHATKSPRDLVALANANPTLTRLKPISTIPQK